MAIRTADLKTRLNTQLETLTTAGAAAAGGTGTGDDINAYAKALNPFARLVPATTAVVVPSLRVTFVPELLSSE